MARLITAAEREMLQEYKRTHKHCEHCSELATVYMFNRYNLPAAFCASHEKQENAALGRS